jgi:hypothetical protein
MITQDKSQKYNAKRIFNKIEKGNYLFDLSISGSFVKTHARITILFLIADIKNDTGPNG